MVWSVVYKLRLFMKKQTCLIGDFNQEVMEKNVFVFIIIIRILFLILKDKKKKS